MKPEWETRLVELAGLSSTELGWDAPNSVAIENARAWMARLADDAPIYIFPSIDGGVHVELDVYSLGLWIDFQNDAEVDIGGIIVRRTAQDPWKGCLGGNGPSVDGVCPGCGRTQAAIAEASETGHCPHLPAF